MRAVLLALAALLAACATIAPNPFDGLFGAADPTRFDRPAVPAAGDSYAATIQPILEKRCVGCHACYDAPCQLKTTSWDGIARGASKIPVYDAARLLPAPTTRLHIDAERASQWRERDFHAVLNEHAATPEANRTAGLMYRLLAMKQDRPGPTHGLQPESLGISADRPEMCPSERQLENYERSQPLGGMPFGLPAMPADEFRALTRWIEAGAPYEGAAPLATSTLRSIGDWERLFNGDSKKEQLFARYAYEHLFLAHLYFPEDSPRRYLRLVRSSTPPGQPAREIASRRPVDDPGVARVYYRFVPERESIVAKTFMPYALDATRLARWRASFLDAPYSVDKLPGYDAETAANPFSTFGALPLGARYRFMLEEAQYTIKGFVKGPVCRGQVAVNVIEDRFWVAFVAPNPAYDQAIETMLRSIGSHAELPTGRSATAIFLAWSEYARREQEYLRARNAFYAQAIRPGALGLGMMWDGDGTNPNAGLTIFRHFDNASVVKGFVGEPPKTAWIVGYPLLERIHYLLVANYDVYGNLGHQLNSRLYMDYLRAEGEFNFLVLLPQAQRIPVRDYWYRGAGVGAREQLYGGAATTLPLESAITYRTADARTELMGLMKAKLAPVLDRRYELSSAPASLQAPLASIASIRGTALQWMPENAVMAVEMPEGAVQTFTLMRDTGHSSVSHLLEGQALLPEEDTMNVTPGVVGAYPRAFYRLKAAQLPAFEAAVRGLSSEADYSKLSERFAMRRTDPGFWAFSDAVMDRYARAQPEEAGVLDYNRLENR